MSAQGAATTIPVIFTVRADRVAMGLVASLPAEATPLT